MTADRPCHTIAPVNKSRPSQQKRQRERQRQERQKEKQARRQEIAVQKASNPSRADGVDPDLEGIQPGPQPPQDWQTETETETE
jgi:CCR4-NOT transcriptional regulation complex NOT5 subunit